MFEMLKQAGVDPNNLDSINSFLAKLDAQDPDLREIFEVAFNNLISDTDVNPQAPTPPAPDGGGLMSKFNNLQEGILRQPQQGGGGIPPSNI